MSDERRGGGNGAVVAIVVVLGILGLIGVIVVVGGLGAFMLFAVRSPGPPAMQMAPAPSTSISPDEGGRPIPPDDFSPEPSSTESTPESTQVPAESKP